MVRDRGFRCFSDIEHKTAQTNVFMPSPFLLVNTVNLNQSTPNYFYPQYNRHCRVLWDNPCRNSCILTTKYGEIVTNLSLLMKPCDGYLRSICLLASFFKLKSVTGRGSVDRKLFSQATVFEAFSCFMSVSSFRFQSSFRT